MTSVESALSCLAICVLAGCSGSSTAVAGDEAQTSGCHESARLPLFLWSPPVVVVELERREEPAYEEACEQWRIVLP